LDLETRLEEERQKAREEAESAFQEAKDNLAKIVKEKDELITRIGDMEISRKQQDERAQVEKEVSGVRICSPVL